MAQESDEEELNKEEEKNVTLRPILNKKRWNIDHTHFLKR